MTAILAKGRGKELAVPILLKNKYFLEDFLFDENDRLVTIAYYLYDSNITEIGTVKLFVELSDLFVEQYGAPAAAVDSFLNEKYNNVSEYATDLKENNLETEIYWEDSDGNQLAAVIYYENGSPFIEIYFNYSEYSFLLP